MNDRMIGMLVNNTAHRIRKDKRTFCNRTHYNHAPVVVKEHGSKRAW